MADKLTTPVYEQEIEFERSISPILPDVDEFTLELGDIINDTTDVDEDQLLAEDES